jgi:hypothetical protein
MEDGMAAEIATAIVELHGTHLTEAGMAGIGSALLAILHTVDIAGSALVHHATHHIVVENWTSVMVIVFMKILSFKTLLN